MLVPTVVSARGLTVSDSNDADPGSISRRRRFTGLFDIAGRAVEDRLDGSLRALLLHNDLCDLTLVHSKMNCSGAAERRGGGHHAGDGDAPVALLIIGLPHLHRHHSGFSHRRSGMARRIRRAHARSASRGTQLIVGNGPLARTIATQIRAQHDFAYRIVGFVEEAGGSAEPPRLPVLGTAADH